MLLASTGEIFLKGKNKGFFVQTLVRNVKAALGTSEVVFAQNKILAPESPGWEKIRFVFGITNYAIAQKTGFEEMGKVAVDAVGDAKTFRVTAARRVKVYKSSGEIDREVGAFVCAEKPGIKVELENPEVEVRIDVFADGAFMYTKKALGLGGLPVGVSGRVFVDVQNEKQATVAAFLMMKRGCQVALSKPLPLLEKFAWGFQIPVRDRAVDEVRVSDRMFEEVEWEQEKKETVFVPLVGMSAQEVDSLYEKIRQL